MDFMYYSDVGIGMKDTAMQQGDSSLKPSCQMFHHPIPLSLPSLQKPLSCAAAAAAEKRDCYCNISSSTNNNKSNHHSDDDDYDHDANDLRRGPWTVEEDLLLVNYITAHGEGRWNSLARLAGLKRTGKSCRLRWLNYLRPDVRRGNITPQEQLLILELHSRWGNRWSKIAHYLPGRTDNEIKNYWRTRVQKHARQLRCDVNSQRFKDVLRQLWMPRLIERIQAAANTNHSSTASSFDPPPTFITAAPQMPIPSLPTTLQHQLLPGSAPQSAAVASCRLSAAESLPSSSTTGPGATSGDSVPTANFTGLCHDPSSPTPPTSDFCSPATDVVADLPAACGWYDEVINIHPATTGHPGKSEGLPSSASYSFPYNQGLSEFDVMGCESSTSWTAPNGWCDTFWSAALDAGDYDVNAELWSSALE